MRRDLKSIKQKEKDMHAEAHMAAIHEAQAAEKAAKNRKEEETVIKLPQIPGLSATVEQPQ